MTFNAGTTLGAYEILSIIGVGGMGEVYKARDTRLNRMVAIKVLSPAISSRPQARARFKREAQTIAALNHPRICTIHDVGQHGGIDYLVMELLEGYTLAERLGRGVLPLDEALKYAKEIVEALDAAHSRDIVHRDLKPSNLFVSQGHIKILDFGLAKLRDAEKDDASTIKDAITVHGEVIGTPAYMSPEQIRGEDLDCRTDIFAFGALLYEMVTHSQPFAGPNAAVVLHHVLGKQVAPPSSL